MFANGTLLIVLLRSCACAVAGKTDRGHPSNNRSHSCALRSGVILVSFWHVISVMMIMMMLVVVATFITTIILYY